MYGKMRIMFWRAKPFDFLITFRTDKTKKVNHHFSVLLVTSLSSVAIMPTTDTHCYTIYRFIRYYYMAQFFFSSNGLRLYFSLAGAIHKSRTPFNLNFLRIILILLFVRLSESDVQVLLLISVRVIRYTW